MDTPLEAKIVRYTELLEQSDAPDTKIFFYAKITKLLTSKVAKEKEQRQLLEREMKFIKARETLLRETLYHELEMVKFTSATMIKNLEVVLGLSPLSTSSEQTVNQTRTRSESSPRAEPLLKVEEDKATNGFSKKRARPWKDIKREPKLLTLKPTKRLRTLTYPHLELGVQAGCQLSPPNQRRTTTELLLKDKEVKDTGTWLPLTSNRLSIPTNERKYTQEGIPRPLLHPKSFPNAQACLPQKRPVSPPSVQVTMNEPSSNNSLAIVNSIRRVATPGERRRGITKTGQRIGTKREVWEGVMDITVGGLKKEDIIEMNGKLNSRRQIDALRKSLQKRQKRRRKFVKK